jgi:hypothetical protein
VENRISIVMPTRNRASLLRRALVGIEAQTLSDREIVVVDDASTDETLAMLEGEFPHVKVVRHEVAHGPSAARNSGVAASTGDWIFFHDDDDLMHPAHLADLLAATLAAPPNSLVAGRSRDFAIVDGKVVLGSPVWTAAERSDTDTLIQFLDPNALRTITHTTILWPRRLFDTETWDETLSFYEDFDLCGRAILSGLHVRGSEVGMYYIRMHSAPRLTSAQDDTAQLLSSARYWLKWATLLRDRPEHRACAQVLRDGLMDCLIRLSNLPSGQDYMPQLRAAFRQWGGSRFYVTPRPRNPLKRAVADAVVNIGGFSALHVLVGMVDSMRQGEKPYLDRLLSPATDADMQDADHIRHCEAGTDPQAAVGRTRATMASRASR